MAERYSKHDLERMLIVEKRSYLSVGRQFGVSGNAVKKAAVKCGIHLPRRRKVNPREAFKHGSGKNLSYVDMVSDEGYANIIRESASWKEIGEKLGYTGKVLASNVKEAIRRRCMDLGIELNVHARDPILDKTKGELFKDRKTWQSARSAIRKSAWKVFMENNPSPRCAVCGYDKHVEVAHVRAVSEFSDDATVREINALDNLIGLCPNHHWEYDHRLLKLDDKQE